MINYIGATVSATIQASSAVLWEIVSDVTRHPELAGSGEVVQTELLTPGPLAVGSRFQSQQNMRGFRYTTVSHVVACKPPYHLAWHIGLPGTPPFGQVWQFELSPQGEATYVRHGVALVYALPEVLPFTLVSGSIGQMEANTMVPTLANLAARAGAPPPETIATSTHPPETATALLPSPWIQGGLWMAGGAVLLGRLFGGRRG